MVNPINYDVASIGLQLKHLKKKDIFSRTNI